MKKSTYTLMELKEESLPEGVDPNKLEAYLVDEEFEVSTFSWIATERSKGGLLCALLFMLRLLL